ncbi:hypothetical protein STEG23_005653, partial [Scotinomys teguina]
MSQKLSSTQARELDKFIEDHLLPNTRFGNEVRAAINIICAFLKERCFQGSTHPVRVSKVVKGGSSGKGTAIKGKSDADLVVFLNNLTSFEDQLNRRGEFIQEIENQLYKFQKERHIWVKFEVQRSTWANPRVLSFKLSSPELQQVVEFDVLPAYDVLGQLNYIKPDPQIYIKLIRECTSLGKEGEFSTCFTELQRNFLKQCPTKLKSLIRLVKHWYQLCKEKLGKPLPPQYALELLTVYAWEHGNGDTEFITAQGFRTVLELVTKYRQLRIYWTVYYDFQHQYISNYLHRQLRRARPVILDPADPTGNVAGGTPEGWWRLAGEAMAWLEYPCFKNWDGSPVRSWDVQEEEEEEGKEEEGEEEEEGDEEEEEEEEEVPYQQEEEEEEEDAPYQQNHLPPVYPTLGVCADFMSHGGSSGKGKMLKGRFEADLVVFLNNLTSFEDQIKRRREFLKEIEKQLCQLLGEKKFPVRLEVLRSWRKNFPGLTLRLSSSQLQQEVEFDVLPAYDLLGSVCFYGKPDPEIYRRLISECTSLRKEGKFSTCFTELQQNFLKHRPTKLKSLIRLVKHWYQL